MRATTKSRWGGRGLGVAAALCLAATALRAQEETNEEKEAAAIRDLSPEVRKKLAAVRREIKRLDYSLTMAAIPHLAEREKSYSEVVAAMSSSRGDAAALKKLYQKGRALKIDTLDHLNKLLKLHQGKFKGLKSAEVFKRLKETELEDVKYKEEWLVNILDDFEEVVQINVEMDARVYKFDSLTYSFPKISAMAMLRTMSNNLEFKWVIRGDTLYVYKEMHEVLFDEAWKKRTKKARHARWLQRQKAKKKEKEGGGSGEGSGQIHGDEVHYNIAVWAGPAGGANVVADLAGRQKILMKDLKKIVNARSELLELEASRKSGRFVRVKEEIKLENKARKDMQIFLERFRNNTLEVLAIYDKLVGAAGADPIRKAFGKTYDQVVEVEWSDMNAEDVAEDIRTNFGVKIEVGARVKRNLLMSLEGEMSVAAILEQVETVLGVNLVAEDGKLIFRPQAGNEADLDD